MNAAALRNRLTAIAALLAAAALSACSTTEGFGEDLQKLGNKIEQKSAETQRGY